MNILPQLAPAFAGSALSALLTFVPNPFVSQIGLAGSMGLAGYGYAKATLREDKEKRPGAKVTRDREIRNLHQQLSDLQGRIRKADRERNQAIEANKTAQAANTGMVQKMKALEAKVGANQAASIDTCAYTKRLNELSQQLEATEARLAEAETALENERDTFDSRVAKARSEALLTPSRRGELEGTVAQLESDKAQIIAAYKNAQDSLAKAGVLYNSEIDNLGNAKELEDTESLQTIRHWQTQAAQLQARIAELEAEAKKPARFGGSGVADVLGNKVIDFFESKGIQFIAHETDPDLDKGLLVSLKAETPVDLETIKRFMGELEVATDTHSRPKVTFEQRCYRFRLANNEPFRSADQTAPNVPLSRLEKTLDGAIHGRIVGGSGSGKTVLLNNLMHYMAHSMKGANVTLLDPKAVDDWGHFTPKYWGEECVEGIVTLANSLKGRVANTVKARKAGKPAPKYSPELFVVDEAQYNYLLAQNADDSHVKERGEQAPNYAKKAKGALAGLLSLGRAYDAIGLFVTQLPQVSKVGLNEGSFDPCVNIFLGVQIDNAIDSFLPGSGFTDTKCKALDKELSIRRKLGQKWVMLVADLPRSEAYLMECPAPGYYHNRFPGDLGGSAKTAETAEKLQSTVETESQTGSTPASCKQSAGVGSTPASESAGTCKPSAHCPKCSHVSDKYHGTKPKANGKYRFICENDSCEKGAKKGTFSAFPLA